MFSASMARQAKAAGAVEMGIEYYPKRKYFGGGNRSPGVFAYHFFNSDGLEIGHSIPDLGQWGEFKTFENPRVWGESFKSELVMRDLDRY